MADMPENAQRSDDGNWWWDESRQQWQPVPGSAADTSTSTTTSTGSSSSTTTDDPAASATYAETQGEIPVSLAEISLTDAEIADIMQRAGVNEEPVA